MEAGDSYLGATPPVQVNATQCGSVKIEVRFITETRKHDSLKKWADLIDRIIEQREVAGRIASIIAGVTFVNAEWW